MQLLQFRISQGTVDTIFGCGGQIQNNVLVSQISSEFRVPNIRQMCHF